MLMTQFICQNERMSDIRWAMIVIVIEVLEKRILSTDSLPFFMTDMVGLLIVFMIQCPRFQKRFLIIILFQTQIIILINKNNMHYEYIY